MRLLLAGLPDEERGGSGGGLPDEERGGSGGGCGGLDDDGTRRPPFEDDPPAP
jgi:hypothetical protein